MKTWEAMTEETYSQLKQCTSSKQAAFKFYVEPDMSPEEPSSQFSERRFFPTIFT